MNCVRKAAIAFLAITIVPFLQVATAYGSEAKQLNLFNWGYYMDPSIIKAFEDKYDVEVVRSEYSSLSGLFAKLNAGGVSQYDIIVPSNYYMQRLIKSGNLQPLNHKLIPNLDNIKSKFKDPKFDPDNKYSAPYQWGTTGIAYNAKKLPNAPKSWAILFDPEINKEYPFSLMPDGQVMMGAACAYEGNKYDCTNKKEWREAGKLLLQTKKRDNFNGFLSANRTLKALARGNVVAGVIYNGDFAHSKHDSPNDYANIKFVIPKEGSEVWVDSMAIPSEAPHPKLANKFINFILSPEIGAKLSNYNQYPTPNKASQSMLDKALQGPPVTPTAEDMKRLHFTPGLAGEKLHLQTQMWTDIKSR